MNRSDLDDYILKCFLQFAKPALFAVFLILLFVYILDRTENLELKLQWLI